MNPQRTAVLVAGAGPAGTGPLVAAIRRGVHGELLGRGVTWVDRAPHLGSGSLSHYDITSDTAASVLLECLAGEGPLRDLQDHPVATQVRSHGHGPLPLGLAARWYDVLGSRLEDVVADHPPSRFVPGTELIALDVGADGIHASLSGPLGPHEVVAERVVLALGGVQHRETHLEAQLAPGVRLADLAGVAERVVTTDELVTSRGQARVTDLLARDPRPRVVVVGGSHSAFTAAWLLLHRARVGWEAGAVTILCRRSPKVFYPSTDAARAEGYPFSPELDVCPATGRVFRFAGLRLDARDLLRSVLGLGDASPEPRVALTPYDDTDASGSPAVVALLEAATVVVSALGYTARTVPVSIGGRPRRLHAETSPRAELVDDRCRVLLDDGSPVPGLWGLGLASGFVPHGAMGGEPSFDGRTNGLWLYQNGVGDIVLDALLG